MKSATLLIALVSACAAMQRPQPVGCICPALYAPQCGINGVTYSNKCEANCAKVAIAYSGACKPKNVNACPPAAPKKDCFCIQVYQPVCGIDGKTYGNSCTAGCAGVLVAYDRECDKGPFPQCLIACDCKNEPVCATDGATFLNQCFLTCHSNHQFQHSGPCKPGKPIDICKDNGKPVCGTDGKTYMGGCKAKAVGIEVAYQGKCLDCKKTKEDKSTAQVCCSDGKTYRNKWAAICKHKKRVAHLGRCGEANKKRGKNVGSAAA